MNVPPCPMHSGAWGTQVPAGCLLFELHTDPESQGLSIQLPLMHCSRETLLSVHRASLAPQLSLDNDGGELVSAICFAPAVPPSATLPASPTMPAAATLGSAKLPASAGGRAPVSAVSVGVATAADGATSLAEGVGSTRGSVVASNTCGRIHVALQSIPDSEHTVREMRLCMIADVQSFAFATTVSSGCEHVRGFRAPRGAGHRTAHPRRRSCALDSARSVG
jgi:hypothetical protein